ncbi:MAG: hypothetical protein HQL76_06315 [Magnetococcales bacterium]|nr:hypothetical protein [Magnetococcales bacterium]
MTLIVDLGPFQEIVLVQFNKFCYGRAMIGTRVTQPQGSWPGSYMEYGYFVADKGFPDPWLQWLAQKIAEHIPDQSHPRFTWLLQADAFDETTGQWVPFKRGLVDFKVNFWQHSPPPYSAQVTVDRIWPEGTLETVSVDSMTLPWAGVHMFHPEYHLTPQNPPPPPSDPPATWPYHPSNRTYFKEQRIRVYPPPLPA